MKVMLAVTLGDVLMGKTEAEQKFEEYHKYLRQEAIRLVSHIKLYQRLHELRAERLDEMNIAPAFFQVVVDALFSTIVLWTHKMFDEKSERGLTNFLTFCEYNLKIFKLEELKRRKNYPEDHWILKDRKPITLETINDDRELIRKLEALPSFKLQRDKFHAHFDKEYFFDRKKLAEEAPLRQSDLTQVVDAMKNIINGYSADYDGNLYVLEPINVTDVNYLLYRHRHKKRNC
jgi:hypothetical protein